MLVTHLVGSITCVACSSSTMGVWIVTSIDGAPLAASSASARRLCAGSHARLRLKRWGRCETPSASSHVRPGIGFEGCWEESKDAYRPPSVSAPCAGHRWVRDSALVVRGSYAPTHSPCVRGGRLGELQRPASLTDRACPATGAGKCARRRDHPPHAFLGYSEFERARGQPTRRGGRLGSPISGRAV